MSLISPKVRAELIVTMADNGLCGVFLTKVVADEATANQICANLIMAAIDHFSDIGREISIQLPDGRIIPLVTPKPVGYIPPFPTSGTAGAENAASESNKGKNLDLSKRNLLSSLKDDACRFLATLSTPQGARLYQAWLEELWRSRRDRLFRIFKRERNKTTQQIGKEERIKSAEEKIAR